MPALSGWAKRELLLLCTATLSAPSLTDARLELNRTVEFAAVLLLLGGVNACLCQSTSQPTKELFKGGDLRGAQVDVPWSVQPFLRSTASVSSIRNTYHYTWGLRLR